MITTMFGSHHRAARLTGGIIAGTFLIGGCPRPGAENTAALQLIAEGLTAPVGLAQPEDDSGRLFIVDQIGLIWIVDATGDLRAAPFLDIRDRVVPLSASYDERGLLSLAFHPDYATNGRFFIIYNAPKDATLPAEFDSQLHLSEFRVSILSDNLADPGSERILLTIAKPQANHNGGQLAFGPDRLLYISVGDGGGAGDLGVGHNPEIGNAQDQTTLLGKILRIDVGDGDDGTGYAIPADNPFITTAGARPEIWANGLRNPWRFSFDQAGRNRLFVGDAGQALFEEVSIVTRGGNYGWRIKEARSCFNPAEFTQPLDDCAAVGANGAPLTDPIIEYPHGQSDDVPNGVAVIGGYVYRGDDIPALEGAYIFGDFSISFVVPDGLLFVGREQPDGTWTRAELTVAGSADGRLGRFLLGFGQDLQGEVYALTSERTGPTGSTGRVFKLASPD